jgi:hypothetical protein
MGILRHSSFIGITHLFDAQIGNGWILLKRK